MTASRNLVVRYGFAVAVTVLAVVVRRELDPLWGLALPLITFVPAIMAGAWFGGLGPGLLTTALCALSANYWFMEPRFTLRLTRTADIVALGMFVGIGVFMSVLTEALSRAHGRLAAALAREEVARRSAEVAAAAIAASESRLAVTLASIGDAIIATDHEGRVTLMNAVAEALTGWTRDEALGRPLERVFVIVNEYSREPAVNPVGKVLREGLLAGLANHTVLISRDGREIPVDDSAAPIRAPDDRLVGVVMVFRDITERRRAERERAALLDAERTALLEAERVNRTLRHVHSVTGAALAAMSTSDLMRELLSRVRTALASDTATILLLTEDGGHLAPVSSDGLRELVVEDLRIPLGQGAAGRIAASEAGLIFNDLSGVEPVSLFLRDRVKSLVGAPLRVGDRVIGAIHVGSSALRQFTEEDLNLLRLVAERVAVAIERARLHDAEREARREAEAANRGKDDFLAAVSHELRAPLHAILGWAQMAHGGKRDEETVVRALTVIERNARLQERLISDLLDISRSSSGRLRLDLQPVDLVAVIAAALDVVRPAAEAKGLHLETRLDGSSCLVSGDPTRLQQVLWNLLSNAIKFTPRGGRVDVRLQRVESHVELSVQDTGDGISADLLPKVFERFRQAARAGTRAQGGLGLGLAIARHLVELHGGTIDARSAGEGQGATFTVKLPVLALRSPVGGVERGAAATEGGAPVLTSPSLDGVRALVVDDEADARELLRMVLEAGGAAVALASSAAEALEVLERERPDVLISDLAMPAEDGYALIRKVRALPPERGGRIAAVAVTAHARAEDRTEALLAGFQLHVPKPVEPTELIAVVASVLGRSGA